MALEQDEDPLIGTKVGPCRIEQRLAAGGMGVVYRAYHGPSDKDVAVKILAPTLATDQEYVTRFFREAGAAGQIDHPNVIRVIDVGRHEDKYFLVMEYVPGETLDRLLEREGRMSLDRAVRFVRGIAAGLAAAHRAGIIHRDVKPGNVIVSRDGAPHLTDFGLARHAETRKGLTIEGTFLGTPEYASPEQVEGRRVDHRTDLYSLGVTFYQLLSGTFPYLGESPMEMAIKRTKEDPRPLEHACPNADRRACAIVHKLIEREPSKRYQSATDLIRDLDAILVGREPRSAQVKAAEAGKEPFLSVEAKRRIRVTIFWGLLAAGVGMAFLSGGLAPRGRFPQAWAAAEGGWGLRGIFLGSAALAAAGAVFAYRRELVYSGRLWSLLLLVPLMLFLGLAAGAMMDRPGCDGPFGTLGLTVRYLGRHLSGGANAAGLAFFFMSASALISFERRRGFVPELLSRLALAVAFVLSYLLGASRHGLAAPFQNFMSRPEISIPLATVTALACVFGTIFLTGYEYGSITRLAGLVTSAAAAVGLYSFGVLVSQPSRQDFAGLLLEPFAGFGASCARSGTFLVGAAIVGLAARFILAAGIRRHDRFYRGK